MSLTKTTSVSLPAYGTGWTAPALPNFRAVEVADGENKYPWRYEANADAMIDKYRKGDCRVTVVNGANAPVVGATVSAQMTEHAFIWGTMISEGAMLSSDPAIRDGYRAQILSGAWNAIYTENACKQGMWEVAAYPHTDKQGAIDCFAVAKAARKWREVRGHVLNYPVDFTWHFPAAVWPADYAGRRSYWRNTHIPDKTATLINDISIWELSNEVNDSIYSSVEGVKYKNPDYLSDCLHAAQAQGGRPLYINDYRDQYTLLEHAAYLEANGVPIAAVGIQGHVSGSFTYESVAGYFTLLQSLTGNVIVPWDFMVTELDYQSVTAEQAGLNETAFVKACFANPQCRGMNNWGTCDNLGWLAGGQSGYFTSPTGTAKPRMESFNALVHGTWKTNSSGATNGSGYHQFRGTFGAYDLTVTSGATTVTRSFELHPGMKEIVIVIP
jgi:GH35 family endo-1,4-beta-xylanase